MKIEILNYVETNIMRYYVMHFLYCDWQQLRYYVVLLKPEVFAQQEQQAHCYLDHLRTWWMTSYKFYFLVEPQEIKGRQSSLISLEASRIKGRQSNLDKLHYLPLIMYIYGIVC